MATPPMVEAAFLPNSQLNNLLNILPPVAGGRCPPYVKKCQRAVWLSKAFSLLCPALTPRLISPVWQLVRAQSMQSAAAGHCLSFSPE
jgi:hypothetical protein